MKIASLGSGSKGNSTIVACGSTQLLVDTGFSVKELERRFAFLDGDPEDLAGILVTHEHSDHSNGVARLAKKYSLPVFLTHGTELAMDESGKWYGHDCDVHIISPDEVFSVGELKVQTVAVPHDAREPVQFLFFDDNTKLGVLTDIGCETPHVIEHYSDCHGLFIECNHDREMLLSGSYHPALKRRVSGDYGHLSNDQALAIIEQVVTANTRKVILGHLSVENNTLKKVQMTIASFAQQHGLEVLIADQEFGISWVEVV